MRRIFLKQLRCRIINNMNGTIVNTNDILHENTISAIQLVLAREAYRCEISFMMICLYCIIYVYIYVTHIPIVKSTIENSKAHSASRGYINRFNLSYQPYNNRE